MARRRFRIRFRPPGVRPGGKVGPPGPFRGRLGAHWWVASLVVAAVILAAGAWLYLRPGAPGPPWRAAGRVEQLAPGEAREPLDGVFVGRLDDGSPAAVAEDPACPLELTESRYRDCRGRLYLLDGRPEGHPGPPLERLPVQVHGDEIFVRP